MSIERITVDRLGHLGDGVAPGPVYATRCLPGEDVEGVITNARMEAPRIVTPSPDRVRPVCPHYKNCGGCSLQHASDDFVAAWKTGIVRQSLAAHGIDIDAPEVVTSPSGTRRRATLSARRTKKGALVGFHAARSAAIAEIDQCQLLHPDLLGAIPAIQAFARLGSSRKGELSVTLTQSPNGIDVAVAGGKPLDERLLAGLADIARAHDLARISWDGEPVATRRPPYQVFGAAQVVPPPGAFLQATHEGEAALQGAVVEAAGSAGKVADLFAGCGTFSLPLAQNSEVHAVESDPEMLIALDHGWRHAQGLKRLTTEKRDLFRQPLLPDELNRFDMVVLDPPRAGAQAQTAEIAASKLDAVAMVSCNPVTFARDVHCLMLAGFRLDWIKVIDQFRWSAHVEMAARLSR